MCDPALALPLPHLRSWATSAARATLRACANYPCARHLTSSFIGCAATFLTFWPSTTPLKSGSNRARSRPRSILHAAAIGLTCRDLYGVAGRDCGQSLAHIIARAGEAIV